MRAGSAWSLASARQRGVTAAAIVKRDDIVGRHVHAVERDGIGIAELGRSGAVLADAVAEMDRMLGVRIDSGGVNVAMPAMSKRLPVTGLR